MREDSQDAARPPVFEEPQPRRVGRATSGATVSIPPRVPGPQPLGQTTLHARLALLLRPKPVSLRPGTDENG